VNFARATFRDTIFTSTFGEIQSVAFSPDGSLLAAGTANGEIWLCRVVDNVLLYIFR
jgi:WD40 repeat protein